MRIRMRQFGKSLSHFRVKRGPCFIMRLDFGGSSPLMQLLFFFFWLFWGKWLKAPSFWRRDFEYGEKLRHKSASLAHVLPFPSFPEEDL